MNAEIRDALNTDRTIDIITIGAKSGLPRRIEIWFTNVSGRIIICGTPGAKGDKGPRTPRDWLANLKANPAFTFCLKESLHVELPARAVEIVDPNDRMNGKATWALATSLPALPNQFHQMLSKASKTNLTSKFARANSTAPPNASLNSIAGCRLTGSSSVIPLLAALHPRVS